MFYPNEIVSFKEADGREVVERILWIDEGYVICYTIDITSENALPMKRKMSHLKALLDEQLLTLVTDEPFAYIFKKEEQLTETQKKIRDDRWELISQMVLKEPGVYDRDRRGSMIRRLQEKTGKTKRAIYKFLRVYWQRGKVKNALLPDYRNSGGSGKERRMGDKKTGRPRKHVTVRGIGVNIDQDMKRIFNICIAKFYHTTTKNPLTFAYDMMLSQHFAESYVYENGVKKPILKPEEQLPTFRQFKYWYEKTFSREQKLRKRKGNRKYELEDRAVLGTSMGEMYGPGSKFQIDATVADFYLVSSFNRNWIIGRPVIYAVIDVFSRMVVGIYVGLEGPSWLGAMMALANATSDKVAFCKKYGVDITEDDWSVKHLPQTLLADRGEFEGYNVERLITAFHMKVENTAPYRGDWKAIIEQYFRTIQVKVKPFTPGYVDTEVRVRGDRDYRLDAELSLDEFTEIIIRCVLYHNNHHWLNHYDADEMMVTDEVNLIPKELWNWGIKNRSGRLRSYSEDIVKLHLLPQKSATVTFKGIEFEGMQYSCERALREGWFSEAREKSWRIQVSYDPRNTDYLYLPSEDGKSYEVLTLLEHQTRYKGRTLHDVDYLLAFEEYKKAGHKHQETQKKLDLYAHMEAIVDKAKKNTKAEQVPMSNAERTKGIRVNHALEKEARRKEEAFLLTNLEDAPSSNAVVETPNTTEVEMFKPKSKIELLRQKQKERLNHAKSTSSV